MARLRDVVFDCHHPARLARFWAAALSGYRVAPYPPEELARLAALGIHDPQDDPSVLVEPTSGAGVRLFFNQVPEPRTTKNRLHLDLAADDPDAEVTRLVTLGARELGRTADWVLLADPEGNEFDVLGP